MRRACCQYQYAIKQRFSSYVRLTPLCSNITQYTPSCPDSGLISHFMKFRGQAQTQPSIFPSRFRFAFHCHQRSVRPSRSHGPSHSHSQCLYVTTPCILPCMRSAGLKHTYNSTPETKRRASTTPVNLISSSSQATTSSMARTDRIKQL